MAFRIPLFFYAAVLITVQVNGQNPALPATPPASGLPLIQADPSCTPLATKCLTDMPFLTGDTIFYLGKIYVSSSGTPPAATGTPPGTPVTSPPTTPPPGTSTPTTPPPGTPPPTTPCPGTPPPTTPPPGTSTPTTPPPGTPPPTTPSPGTPPPASGTPPTNPGEENSCSIASYVMDTCQGIKVLLSRREDGAYCLKQAAYNKVTNSVAIMENMWLPASADKAIMKQIFGYHGQITENGQVIYFDPSSATVKTAQAREFVLLGGKKNEYALFTTCCKSIVFALYSESVVSGKTMQTYDAEITSLVATVGIQYTDLKDVPTDMPIKLDAILPAVQPVSVTVTASAAAGVTVTGGPPGSPNTVTVAAGAAAGAVIAPASPPPPPPPTR